MIDIDWTLYAQIINFLLLVFLLNLVLFRPLRKALQARQQKILAQEAEIGRLADRSQGIGKEIKDSLSEARRQGANQREALKKEGSEAETSMLDAVKKEVEAEWERIGGKIKEDMGKARAALKTQVQSFAQSLAAKILGRELS
jgi:F-type H+-transporting ATPase subunit b